MFGRKRKEAEKARLEAEHAHEELMKELSKPICQRKGGKHLYRDFPPFLTYSWNGVREKSHIDIKEYYVCCLCAKKEEKDLETWTYQGYSKDEFFAEVNKYREKYKDILQPRAIVEDMVNDAIMVDRQKLMFWDQLHAPEPPEKEPFQFQLKEKENDEGEFIGRGF